ncbi:MAG: Methionine aminopeptidase [Candidatus Yanofskybacteria bacterium GW2011_GWA1_48_10]|uniref:Methionine aminopeptidase n=2 Tax=Candidatus Yanofskyibacteriota TaxID=1752733 RepID=A0A0G1U797_9BACT|nr:MAG: Methionine aminopeptidase [Candidatus Yanofskybacteria bacterium GW2011_GWA1_48_10]OGN06733.1 MAG: type I methionyl aminopeptidase [Candidatus Yanofskybacteria bacterium RIFCSPHIGHO2_01_FULL_48_25b]
MTLKTSHQIRLMREGGQILAEILDTLTAAVRPGIQTLELEALARKLILNRKAKPSFFNYRGFPAALCVSLNEEIVHGVPSTRVIKSGDLVKLDLGIKYKGLHTDSARSIVAGKGNFPLARKLIAVAEEALAVGIAESRVGRTIGDVGSAIHGYVKSQKMDVVRDLVGHGIGVKVHEEPEVPNYGKPSQGERLVEGMVFAIEPMIVVGSYKIQDGADGFSFVTTDGKPAAHAEHTIAVTNDGPLILSASSRLNK